MLAGDIMLGSISLTESILAGYCLVLDLSPRTDLSLLVKSARDIIFLDYNSNRMFGFARELTDFKISRVL